MLQTAILLFLIVQTKALDLEYLDPAKLQTVASPAVQESAALGIIKKYDTQSSVVVDPHMFRDNKDVFTLNVTKNEINIKASSGVAAVWGFYYYRKKYCKSHIAWQGVKNIVNCSPYPEVNETVVANDRFRYYQNVCTASYSFVWWNGYDWMQHVEWMALNGINLVLAPVAQEDAWARVYRQIGMTDEEIDKYFTGPAFLSWFRMGNVHGWGGPMPQSWHELQKELQNTIVNYMLQLGMVPVFPAFNGHVPKAFSRIYPNSSFHKTAAWNDFNGDYCCDLFLNPSDPVFKTIGKMFLKELTNGTISTHIYSADPFNEIEVYPWSVDFAKQTAVAISSTLSEFDNQSVWLLQNWMFVNAPDRWPKETVRTFLNAIPNGRVLVLDLQSEQWPQYELYDMYFGQPFIWSMLHNFGGTLGMFGDVITINKNVYEARARTDSTMIGIGLTPEGINQNYVVYELMLESAYRTSPVEDLEEWVGDYSERRYATDTLREAWKYLLRSVYSFNSLNRVRGKYAMLRRPTFRFKPWAWYKSSDLFEAFRLFAIDQENVPHVKGFYYDLADVTRQAMQYRAEQLYMRVVVNRYSNTWTFNATINQYLDVLNDMQDVLASSEYFTAYHNWFKKAESLARGDEELYVYRVNARNQISLWGPNGEITDYACKQWAEMFKYYYIPRWTVFLSSALDAKMRNEFFDEKAAQNIVRTTVELEFLTVNISAVWSRDIEDLARNLYKKWAVVPGLEDLPFSVIKRDHNRRTTLADIPDSEESEDRLPTVVMLRSTTPE